MKHQSKISVNSTWQLHIYNFLIKGALYLAPKLSLGTYHDNTYQISFPQRLQTEVYGWMSSSQEWLIWKQDRNIKGMVEQMIDILTWILQNIKDSCQDLAKKGHPKIPKTELSDFVIWLFCKADLLSVHFDMTHFFPQNAENVKHFVLKSSETDPSKSSQALNLMPFWVKSPPTGRLKTCFKKWL